MSRSLNDLSASVQWSSTITKISQWSSNESSTNAQRISHRNSFSVALERLLRDRASFFDRTMVAQPSLSCVKSIDPKLHSDIVPTQISNRMAGKHMLLLKEEPLTRLSNIEDIWWLWLSNIFHQFYRRAKSPRRRHTKKEENTCLCLPMSFPYHWLLDVMHMVIVTFFRGSPLLPYMLVFLISSKGSFRCTFPGSIYHSRWWTSCRPHIRIMGRANKYIKRRVEYFSLPK